MLSAIAGYDGADPRSADRPVPEYRSAMQVHVLKLRLGVLRSPFFDNLNPEIAKAVEAAIGVLRKLTASISETMLPVTSVPLDEIFTNIRSVEAYTYHSRWLAEAPEKYQPSTRQRLLQNSADVKASAYAQSLNELAFLRRKITETFATTDLLITPTVSLLPEKISDGGGTVGGFKYPAGVRNTAPFNVLGLPAISVPCGFTTADLPIGLQITGAPFAESTVLALAHAYEQATKWHSRRPPV